MKKILPIITSLYKYILTFGLHNALELLETRRVETIGHRWNLFLRIVWSWCDDCRQIFICNCAEIPGVDKMNRCGKKRKKEPCNIWIKIEIKGNVWMMPETVWYGSRIRSLTSSLSPSSSMSTSLQMSSSSRPQASELTCWICTRGESSVTSPSKWGSRSSPATGRTFLKNGT